MKDGAARVECEAMTQWEPTWPRIELEEVPRPEEAAAIAQRIRQAILPPDAQDEPLCHPERLCELGHFRLRRRRLTAAQGDVQGWIFAEPGDSFLIEVDDEPAGGWDTVPEHLREEVGRQRLRFRVAHEIGHSFFFSRTGDTPEPLLPTSPKEEEFCDAFAGALLVPRDVVLGTETTPEGVVELHRRFDVSMQCAAHALQEAHGPDFFIGIVLNAENVSEDPLSTYVQWCEPWDYPDGFWQRGELLKEAVREGHAIKPMRRWRSRQRLLGRALYLADRGQVIVTAQPA